MKVFHFLAFFPLFQVLYAIDKRPCRYDCKSEFANRYGSHNYGGWQGFSFPSFRKKGYTPVSFTALCDSFTTLSEENHPVDIPGVNNHFAVLCSEGIKVYRAIEGELVLAAAEEVSYTGEAFLTTGFKSITLSANNQVVLYSFLGGKISEEVVVSSEHAVSAAAFVTPDDVYSFFEGSVVITSRATKEESTISVENENGLKYSVIGAGEVLYFCNAGEVVKVTPSGTSVLDLSALQLSCSSIMANSETTVLISADSSTGSVLAEIDTESFSALDIVGTYNFTISGVSRQAWTEGGQGMAFLGVLSDAGVYVIVESHPVYPRGAIYSRFTSTSPLEGRPTLTGFGDPVVFDSDSVIAYTSEHLVKFFDTEVLEGLDDYEFYDFLPNPLGFHGYVVGLTTSAEAVVYSICTRFIIGDEVPENACPFGELPEVPEDNYWMSLMSGVAAGASLPFLGTLLCKKMRYFGEDEDDDVEVELYSDDEYLSNAEEEEEEYLTPLPISESTR